MSNNIYLRFAANLYKATGMAISPYIRLLGEWYLHFLSDNRIFRLIERKMAELEKLGIKCQSPVETLLFAQITMGDTTAYLAEIRKISESVLADIKSAGTEVSVDPLKILQDLIPAICGVMGFRELSQGEISDIAASAMLAVETTLGSSLYQTLEDWLSTPSRVFCRSDLVQLIDELEEASPTVRDAVTEIISIRLPNFSGDFHQLLDLFPEI